MEGPVNGEKWEEYFPLLQLQQTSSLVKKHDFPIRRFCPAWSDEADEGTPDPSSPPPPPPPLDLFSPHHPVKVHDFVDSLINMDTDGTSFVSSEEVGENAPFSSSSVVNAGIHNSFTVDVFQGDGRFDIGVSTEIDQDQGAEAGVDQGLHLVHSILACAEAVSCRDTQLAQSLLSQLWLSVFPTDNSLQRVSYSFAAGLDARLSLLHNAGGNGNFGLTLDTINDKAVLYPTVTRREKIDAFRLLYQSTPYITFGFLAANEAISLAAQGKDSLHIIDLGMEHTLQWPSLLQALGSRPGGPPKCVRITEILGLDRDADNSFIFELESSIQQLIGIASSVGIASLEYNLVTEEPTPSLFTKEKLKVREGEALFVNSIMHLHQYLKKNKGYLKEILQAMKKLGPTLVTVVEQDANHNGPFFMGRFLESLHYYSAIFDSLEASLPRESPERMKIERVHYGEEIRNIVGKEGMERVERHERVEQWRRQLGRAGFQAVAPKSMEEVRVMVSRYGCEGYTVEAEKGCLLLGWEGRPLMSASAWQVQSYSPS